MYALPEMGAASLRDGDEGTIVMVVLYAHDARVQRYSPPWKGAAPNLTLFRIWRCSEFDGGLSLFCILMQGFGS